jgi:N-acetylmuramoyl-L-alanine amidase
MNRPILDRPSPHHSPRGGGQVPKLVVLHDTTAVTAASTLGWFADPASAVSAHYLVDRDGTLYRCVEEARSAWHAGVSAWEGRSAVNTWSIGIELVHRAPSEYPPAQLAALHALLVDVCQRHGIPPRLVVGHAHVAMPRGRKSDVEAGFPWPTMLDDLRITLAGSP